MVRITFWPKSIEENIITNITTHGFDQGVVAEVLRPCDHHSQDIVTVALCQDGRGADRGRHDLGLREKIQQLFDHWSSSWGHRYTVVVQTFSFLSNPNEMLNILNTSDIFYMAGVFAPVCPEWQTSIQPGGRSHILVTKLRDLVQYDALAYIGICGGAMLAGAGRNHYGLTPFDLLSGTKVQYNTNAGPTMVSVDSSTASDIAQITKGCGLALYIKPGRCAAISFPTIKNSLQWKPFAEESTVELSNLVEHKAQQSYAYSDGNGHHWHFCLQGYWLYSPLGNLWFPLLTAAQTRQALRQHVCMVTA